MSALVPILPDRDRRRLVSTVGLLASDRDGEVVAAARATGRLLQPYGTTLARLVEVALSPAPRAHRPDPVRADNHRNLARMCLGMSQHLSAWEVAFCRDIARGCGPLTPRQVAKVKAIEAKIESFRDE